MIASKLISYTMLEKSVEQTLFFCANLSYGLINES